jgi:prepilin-type N-terminal cleavage/methylation domain-containing protein
VSRLRRLRRDDSGLTLVEMMVAIFIMSILGLMLVSAFRVMARSNVIVDDEASGLADVRKVSERLGRDVRNARGVDAGASTNKLVLWIDFDSDYRRDASESVEWRLQLNAADPTHYDVLRIEGGTTQVIQARSVVSDLAFTYDVPAPDTRLVETTLNYDAIIETGTVTRTLFFAERLRNVDDVS